MSKIDTTPVTAIVESQLTASVQAEQAAPAIELRAISMKVKSNLRSGTADPRNQWPHPNN